MNASRLKRGDQVVALFSFSGTPCFHAAFTEDVENEKNGASSGPGDDTAGKRAAGRCGRITTTVKVRPRGVRPRARGGATLLSSPICGLINSSIFKRSALVPDRYLPSHCRGRVRRGVAPSLGPSRWTPVWGWSYMSSVFLCLADDFQQKCSVT